MIAMNILHPFREGNGRTERIFISQLIRFNGNDIDFSDIDTDCLMFSTIQSAQGITDNLVNLFKENKYSHKNLASKIMLARFFVKNY